MIIGGTALVMSPQMAIGGANETAATMLFAIVFLFSLTKAYVHIRRGRVALRRRMDDSGVCDRVGGWHGFLAWLHNPIDGCRDLDQLHQSGSHRYPGVLGTSAGRRDL
jgi:hypothetical protein